MTDWAVVLASAGSVLCIAAFALQAYRLLPRADNPIILAFMLQAIVGVAIYGTAFVFEQFTDMGLLSPSYSKWRAVFFRLGQGLTAAYVVWVLRPGQR